MQTSTFNETTKLFRIDLIKRNIDFTVAKGTLDLEKKNFNFELG